MYLLFLTYLIFLAKNLTRIIRSKKNANDWKIKKISNGPVVTLYEFEPAPGIKVSKIISLSDDIARHTSSISSRVSVIPGKNTGEILPIFEKPIFTPKKLYQRVHRS